MAASRRNARRPAPKPTLGERGAAVRAWLLGVTRPLLLGVTLVGLVTGGVFTWRSLQAMPVERIIVTGKLEHLRQEAVREALASELDAGLVFLRLDALRDRLEELPWIYRANLRRRFPDTLEVDVIEQRPIARWGDGGFLNHEAHIIQVSDSEHWSTLPQIRGPEGSAPRLMAQYQRLLEQFGPEKLMPVVIEEDAFGQLSVTLDAGLELQLGDRDFARRLQNFLLLWRKELRGAELAARRVDMRYEGGAAVAFAGNEQVVGLLTDSQGQVAR